MKKFKIIYVIVIILNLILVFTKGFPANMIIYSYIDRRTDGFQGNVSLSVINCIIIAITIILTIATTLNKDNKINIKWLFCLATILIALFVPIGIHHYSGGFWGKIDEENMYLWNVGFYLNRFVFTIETRL